MKAEVTRGMHREEQVVRVRGAQEECVTAKNGSDDPASGTDDIGFCPEHAELSLCLIHRPLHHEGVGRDVREHVA